MQRGYVNSRKPLDKTSITQAGDRGSLEFGTRPVEYKGSIMSIASKPVVTVPPTMTVKGAADTMTKYRFRRLPVTNPGTNRLLGVIGSSDIIEFLGGGEKYLLIEKKHNGNFLAAINESIREIMVTDVVTLGMEASVKDALELMCSSGVGGLVLVDGERKVCGIVTERDFVFLLANKVAGKRAAEYMTKKVVTTTPRMSLGDATRTMVRNSFRRLPVISSGFLTGILTTRLIIEYIGRNHIFSKIVENRVEEVLKTPVEEIMKAQVPTAGPDTDLGEMARIMEESGTGTVCVVDDRKLLGIITERDILKALSA